jgi:hypothetical protein
VEYILFAIFSTEKNSLTIIHHWSREILIICSPVNEIIQGKIVLRVTFTNHWENNIRFCRD